MISLCAKTVAAFRVKHLAHSVSIYLTEDPILSSPSLLTSSGKAFDTMHLFKNGSEIRLDSLFHQT